jgi:hypothetical protein
MVLNFDGIRPKKPILISLDLGNYQKWLYFSIFAKMADLTSKTLAEFLEALKL